MALLYKDLVFETSIPQEKQEEVDIYQQFEDTLYYYKMELYLLPEGVNLRCDDVKIYGVNQFNSKYVYFHLLRNFDIFFAIKSITNAKYIKKLELCYTDGFEKIKQVEFNEDICVPLHIHKCIKVEYDNEENIPLKIEMICSTGLLKHEYKSKITNIIFP